MARVRDLMAAHALSGMLCGMFIAEGEGETWEGTVRNAKAIARLAYDVADEAMAIRDVPPRQDEAPQYMRRRAPLAKRREGP